MTSGDLLALYSRAGTPFWGSLGSSRKELQNSPEKSKLDDHQICDSCNSRMKIEARIHHGEDAHFLTGPIAWREGVLSQG